MKAAQPYHRWQHVLTDASPKLLDELLATARRDALSGSEAALTWLVIQVVRIGEDGAARRAAEAN
jgi:hypothetical protein